MKAAQPAHVVGQPVVATAVPMGLAVPQGTDVEADLRYSHPPNSWSSGLCDCSADCTSCCSTMWCGPNVVGQVRRVQHTHGRTRPARAR